MYELGVEAFAVGIVIVLLSFLLKKIEGLLDVSLDKHMFLFIVGALTHVLFEMIGFNAWYCKNGNACKK